MSSELRMTESRSCIDDQTLALRVVIAYENVAAALRARRVSEWLAAHLESDMELDSTVWEFDALDHPHLREQAASEALAADLIIISAQENAELPKHVKEWITRWVPRKRGESAALVALLQQASDNSSEASLLCDYLRQAAQQGQMDFFCKAGDWYQQNNAAYAVEVTQHRPEHPAVAPSVKVFQEASAYQGWGLNE